MQAKDFREVLRSFADLISNAGDARRAAELRTLADAIGHADPAQAVSKIVAPIQKHWKASKRVASYPADLAAQVERIKSILTVSGAKAASDCAALLKLFSGDASGGADAFAADITSAIVAPPMTKVGGSKRGATLLTSATIEEIADQLICNRLNNTKFDAALVALEARKLRKAELQAVANRFLGAERTFKSNAEIVKAIRTRQLQDALQASRDRRIEKIAV